MATRLLEKAQKVHVEENEQRLFSVFRSVTGEIILAGDSKSMKRAKAAGILGAQVLDAIRYLMDEGEEEEEEGEGENQELKYLTSEPKIPKLFCQIGDKARGWSNATVRLYTTLLLNLLGAGKGGNIIMTTKGKSERPPWFSSKVNWKEYTAPGYASMEDNVDVIRGVFDFFDLSIKTHCKYPVVEVDEQVDGELGDDEEQEEERGRREQERRQQQRREQEEEQERLEKEEEQGRREQERRQQQDRREQEEEQERLEQERLEQERREREWQEQEDEQERLDLLALEQERQGAGEVEDEEEIELHLSMGGSDDDIEARHEEVDQELAEQVNRALEPVTLEEETASNNLTEKNNVTSNLEKQTDKKQNRKTSKEENNELDGVIRSMRGRQIKKKNFLDL